jgi:SAM-dependent methyltransferase
MFLVLGKEKEDFKEALEQAGFDHVHTGGPEDLENGALLRKYNFIVVTSLKAWKAAYLNGLWETDSFVILCGNIPPIVQVYAGIRTAGCSQLRLNAIILEDPGLIDKMESGEFYLDEEIKGFCLTEAEGGLVMATVRGEREGRLPFLVRSGRCCHFAANLSEFKEENRSKVMAVFLNLISLLVQESGIELGSGNIPVGFDSVSELIPQTFQGPNARDYGYVLRRVNRVFNVLARFTAVKDLRSSRALDVGCGFGTLSVVSRYLQNLGLVYGVDYDDNLVNIGNKLVEELGVDRVTFSRKEMTELHDLKNRFEIVISNNSINYLQSNEHYKRTLQGFYDALVPSGALIILTPSRLHPIEAFTRFPGLQVLPRGDANRIREQYQLSNADCEIIKLPSPFELIYWLGDIGFENIRVIDAYTLRACSWDGYFKPRFYVVGEKC